MILTNEELMANILLGEQAETFEKEVEFEFDVSIKDEIIKSILNDSLRDYSLDRSSMVDYDIKYFNNIEEFEHIKNYDMTEDVNNFLDYIIDVYSDDILKNIQNVVQRINEKNNQFEKPLGDGDVAYKLKNLGHVKKDTDRLIFPGSFHLFVPLLKRIQNKELAVLEAKFKNVTSRNNKILDYLENL